MAVTITWNIVQFDVIPSQGGLTEVVKSIHWSAVGTDGQYNGSNFGIVSLAPAESGSFVPYDQITEPEAIDWVKTALGPVQVAKTEEIINNQIEAEKNPPTTNPPLPWG